MPMSPTISDWLPTVTSVRCPQNHAPTDCGADDCTSPSMMILLSCRSSPSKMDAPPLVTTDASPAMIQVPLLPLMVTNSRSEWIVCVVMQASQPEIYGGYIIISAAAVMPIKLLEKSEVPGTI